MQIPFASQLVIQARRKSNFCDFLEIGIYLEVLIVKLPLYSNLLINQYIHYLFKTISHEYSNLTFELCIALAMSL